MTLLLLSIFYVVTRNVYKHVCVAEHMGVARGTFQLFTVGVIRSGCKRNTLRKGTIIILFFNTNTVPSQQIKML